MCTCMCTCMCMCGPFTDIVVVVVCVGGVGAAPIEVSCGGVVQSIGEEFRGHSICHSIFTN